MSLNKNRNGDRKRQVRFCHGSYLFRRYLLPSIKLEKTCSVTYLCVVFLKWYAGVSIIKKEEKA